MTQTAIAPHALEDTLQTLVASAQQSPAGSPERRKMLTRLIRVISPQLWKDQTPDYNDALQQTWEYFCRNLDRYEPERANVVTWLNAYLRWRLWELKHASKELPFSQLCTFEIEIADPRSVPMISWLDMVKEWAIADPELPHIHLKNHPHITAQWLILRRLPPATSWKTLSQEMGVPIPTLSSFYQRRCVPCLQQFGKSVHVYDEF